MEELWNLEDKWKLSTPEAVLVLASTAFVLVCLCIVTILRRRARQKQLTKPSPSFQEYKPLTKPGLEPHSGTGGMKQTLVESMQWSKTSKWKESPMPLLGGKGAEGEVAWGSHNSESPVWQRPILMGEKCEFPNYSGLIMYDQRGKPVKHSETRTTHQEMKAAVERTTLRDLL